MSIIFKAAPILIRTDIAMCDTVDRVWFDVKLSYLLHLIYMGTQYGFDILSELEMIDPMATVTAVHQLMAVEELNFQKEIEP